MATTAVERRLPIAGELVETGDWIEVRSPYSGEVVGRVAKGGAAEAKRAVDAAEAAMREPLPAHERAAILDRVAPCCASARTSSRARSAPRPASR